MKIITEPSVYLLGRMQLDRGELQTFLADINASEWTTAGDVDGDILVEVGGRTCYQSWGKGRSHRDHLANLIESGHLSCLEHSVYTVLITGVSRSLTHELIRHRHLSPSQLSQRYVDESVAEYVCPDIIWGDPELRELWLTAVMHAHTAYKVLSDKLKAKLEQATLANGRADHEWLCGRCFGTGMEVRFKLGKTTDSLDLVPTGGECQSCQGKRFAKHAQTEMRKASRQAARSVLPNATETKIQLTGNVRAWRELLVKRGSRHAEPEIRKLANAILDLLHKESPNLFGDFERYTLPDGTNEITLPPSED
jgi:thymidylate synthase (FAD)